MDSNRRTLLTTGAAVAAAAAAPRVFAQPQTGKGETAMAFYEKGNVRIRYEDTGSGFPLLLISGGGHNATIAWNADFVYAVRRDFVRSCQTPVLIMPDDSPPHPYAIARESAMLAPKSEVSLYPWKDTKDKIPVAVRHVRSFLRVHRMGTA